MRTFIEIIVHTPWWVYLFFAYVIYTGIKATRPRCVPILRLLIAPCIFTLLSVHTLAGRVGDDLIYLAPWSVAVFTGIGIGWLENRRLGLVADRRNRRLHIPGSAVTLLLFLFFFGAQYYYGFMRATNPQTAKGAAFVVFILTVSGIGAGVMWTRAATYLYTYIRTAPAKVAE